MSKYFSFYFCNNNLFFVFFISFSFLQKNYDANSLTTKSQIVSIYDINFHSSFRFSFVSFLTNIKYKRIFHRIHDLVFIKCQVKVRIGVNQNTFLLAARLNVKSLEHYLFWCYNFIFGEFESSHLYPLVITNTNINSTAKLWRKIHALQVNVSHVIKFIAYRYWLSDNCVGDISYFFCSF